MAPPGTSSGAGRHRTTGLTALRGGATLAIAGLTLPVLPLSGADVPDHTGRLALSAEEIATGLGTAGSAEPVSPAATVTGPAGATSADLIKAVDRQRQADTARAAETKAAEDRAARQEEERRTGSTDCGVSDSYGGVADAVQTVGNALECVFRPDDVLGVGSRGNASDHPGGYALDLMTDSGDPLASCVMRNADALGVEYAIYNRRINTGSGWEQMEDRGGRTANHEDHVHISFSEGASPDVAALRGCGGGGAGSDERA